MAKVEGDERASILDPVERVSEVVFGLLMAVTITGSVSVATAGREEVRTMMHAALGCNLAWGLADAVMYLIQRTTERTRAAKLLARLREASSPSAAYDLIARELPERLGAVATPTALEEIRKCLLALPNLSTHRPLRVDDFVGALGVFLLVVCATFPVVIPFVLIDSAAVALRVSNVVAVAMLFLGGWLLGRYSGGTPWLAGVALAAVGTMLVGVIIALGG